METPQALNLGSSEFLNLNFQSKARDPVNTVREMDIRGLQTISFVWGNGLEFTTVRMLKNTSVTLKQIYISIVGETEALLYM